jgi:hypothetical protein
VTGWPWVRAGGASRLWSEDLIDDEGLAQLAARSITVPPPAMPAR